MREDSKNNEFEMLKGLKDIISGMKSIFEDKEEEIQVKPSITTDKENNLYVIIGTTDTVNIIHKEYNIKELINVIDDVSAFKIQSIGKEQKQEKEFSKGFSLEDLLKVYKTMEKPIKYFSEDKRGLISKLKIYYNVPSKLIHVMPITFDKYNNYRYSLNPIIAHQCVFKIINHWERNNLDELKLLNFFLYFEKFVDYVNGYEIFMPDLRKFRKIYNGSKIAVVCHNSHVPLFKNILDNKEPSIPFTWDISVNNIAEKTRYFDGKDIKQTYKHLKEALEIR